MKKNFYSISTFFLLSLSLFFTACSKEKQVLPTDSSKISNTTETAKTAATLKTETATTYGKIVTVAFSSATDGFTTTFTNSSVIIDVKNYEISSYDWDFGDGKTETRPDNKPFTHDYIAAGNYNVKLTANVVDALTEAPVDGTFVSIKRVNVTAIIPTAGFTVNYSPDGLTAIFNNTSTNGATYSWDFNDGATSTLQNPTHLYAKEGTYTVKLTVTSKTGNTTSTIQTVTIDTTLIADFDFIIVDDTVIFTNKSIKGVSYIWNFGDGEFDTTFNTRHTYIKDGNYKVTLTAIGRTGKKTSISKIVLIRINPIADFSFTKKDTLIGMDTVVIVKFTNLSRNAVKYKWDFGDGGAASIETNPTHLYKFFGTYTVQLTAISVSGRNDSKTEIIRLP